MHTNPVKRVVLSKTLHSLGGNRKQYHPRQKPKKTVSAAYTPKQDFLITFLQIYAAVRTWRKFTTTKWSITPTSPIKLPLQAIKLLFPDFPIHKWSKHNSLLLTDLIQDGHIKPLHHLNIDLTNPQLCISIPIKALSYYSPSSLGKKGISTIYNIL